MAVVFRKASASNVTDCFEVGRDGDVILFRDSKNRQKAPIEVPIPIWRTFVESALDGALDL